jgi:hypothetical protein
MPSHKGIFYQKSTTRHLMKEKKRKRMLTTQKDFPLTPNEEDSFEIPDFEKEFLLLSDSSKTEILQRLLKHTPDQTLQILSCVILPTLKRNFLVFLYLTRPCYRVNLDIKFLNTWICGQSLDLRKFVKHGII